MSFDFIDRKHGQPKPVSTPEAPKPGMWWCDDCEEEIAWDEVTFQERHDERVGGCGCIVYPSCATCKNTGWVYDPNYWIKVPGGVYTECETCDNPNRRMSP